MHEPPSHELVRLLTELQLCHPNDLRRARGRVRRLSYDLPAFDSVWIDSLVQLRLLTPYQAKMLEQGHAEQLRVGPYVIVDELGHGFRATTFLAQPLNRRDRRVLKRHRVAPDRVNEVRRQMSLLLECAEGFAHPHIVVPSELLSSDDGKLVTVSRYVPGLPLSELLVRRGRFPAFVVFEIGRQLLEGLSGLHAKSLIHGDICMSNVRLTENGLAVLVDASIRRIVHPEITIHDKMSLESYDGIAPELIGTGEPPSAGSELYALGCLLWQLLAGRPPYTTADPLAKLAAHQALTIDDVRTLAPDTPEMLATTIQQMTSPSPDRRPRSFNEVLQRWGKSGSFGRSRLKQFRRLFDTSVPHFARPATPDRLSGAIWIVGLMFAMTGVSALLYDAGMRTELLSIARKVKSFVKTAVKGRPGPPAESTNSSSTTARNEAPRVLLPLPAPVNGVVLLKEAGPYEGRSLNDSGSLWIRSATGVNPEIRVDDAQLSIGASTVTLEGVTIRHANDSQLNGVIYVKCQQLQIINCEFLGNKSRQSYNGTSFIAWRPLISHDPQPTAITIKNTVFHGANTAISLQKTPRTLRVVNCLKTGKGTFVALSRKGHAADFKLELDRLTLRQTGPLIELGGEFASKHGTAAVKIDASNSVFQLADTTSALIVLVSDAPRQDIAKSIEVKASNSVVAPDTALLKTFDPTQGSFSGDLADERDDQFEGLQVSDVRFVGSDDLFSTRNSRTVRIDGPKSSELLPGIDLRHLSQGN